MNRTIKTVYCAWVGIDRNSKVTVRSVDFGITAPYPQGKQSEDFIQVLFQIPGYPLDTGTIVWVSANVDTGDPILFTTCYRSQENALNLNQDTQFDAEQFEELIETMEGAQTLEEVVENLKNGFVVDGRVLIRIELP